MGQQLIRCFGSRRQSDVRALPLHSAVCLQCATKVLLKLQTFLLTSRLRCTGERDNNLHFRKVGINGIRIAKFHDSGFRRSYGFILIHEAFIHGFHCGLGQKFCSVTCTWDCHLTCSNPGSFMIIRWSILKKTDVWANFVWLSEGSQQRSTGISLQSEMPGLLIPTLCVGSESHLWRQCPITISDKLENVKCCRQSFYRSI